MPATASQSKSGVITGLILTLVLFGICVLASTFLRSFAGGNLSAAVLFFITRLLFWLSLGLVYLYCIKREDQPLLMWAENKRSIVFHIIAILVMLLVITAGSAAIRLVAHAFKWSTDGASIKTILGFNAPLKLFIVVTAAVVEELIFRGYLMPRLQLYFKSYWWPVIISSLVFGLAHFHYGTFVNIAGPVFIGFVFACYYQKYRNIKTLIICHFLIDFVALFFFK